MEVFSVELFKPDQVYFAGQEVAGRVLLSLSEPMKMTCLSLELSGMGYVHWTEEESRGMGDNKVTEIIDYGSTETYIEDEIVLFPGPSLDIGDHEFPFSYVLGPDLPSSFEGTHGNIRYYVQAVIVRSWLWNHRVKSHLTVNSMLDLNYDPSCKLPGESRDHKNFCCMCCKSGPLSVVICTDRTGYVPGEYIVFSAEVDNKSRKKIKGIEVKLMENVTFIAGGKTKESGRIVMEETREGIGPGDSDVWDRASIIVPPLPPTNLGGNCGIIQVQYELLLRVEPAGVGFSLRVSVPVIIGAIPLKEFMNQFSPAIPEQLEFNPAMPQLLEFSPAVPQSPQFGPTVPLLYPEFGPSVPPYPASAPAETVHYTTDDSGLPEYPGHPLDPGFVGGFVGGFVPPASASAPPLPTNFSAYANLPPPSYADSFWGQVNVRNDGEDENTTGNWNFAPKYVTYNVVKPPY